MNQIQKIPKATKTIMTLSILIPTTAFLFPSIIKHIFYDITFLRTFQIHRLLLSIFLCVVDINLLFKLLTRYQILSSTETQQLKIDTVDTTIELLWFTFTLCIPLFFANLIEGVNTFNEGIDMAYVKFMCELMPRGSMINFYNFSVDSSYFVYYYFFYVMAMSKLKSKCYYGLVYASCYVYFRRNLGGVPDTFVDFVGFMDRKCKDLYVSIRSGRLGIKPVVGRKISSYKKKA